MESPPALISQRSIMTKARPIVEESIRELYHDLLPECLMMADFGCSSGPNALLVVSEIIDAINEAAQSLNRKAPTFGVFLNDLPGNDFNTIFNLLPSFYKRLEEEKGRDFGPCFVSGTPRSFHGRVFPDRFLHFVHSSCSIHWLSQVPRGLESENGVALNKGNMYMAKTSPPEISMAYYAQFKKDFTLFLRSRAREIVPGGHMVLTFRGGISSNEPDPLFDLLGSTLHSMVLEGMIEKEKLDSLNLPFYAPTVEEVRNLVEAEGSFALDRLESTVVDWSIDTTQDPEKQAHVIAKGTRAVTESLLTSTFGEAVMEDLFLKLGKRAKERMPTERIEFSSIVVSLTKKE